MVRTPEFIDAVPILTRWYGPDSIACHRVRILNEKEAESEFTVGQNLCGPLARPPMFNHLVFKNGVFTTQASAEDAGEHFIKSVDISVIPGHNIMGLVAKGLELVYDNQDVTMYVVSFDFMRFRGFVLPGQEVKFSGEVDKIDKTILATLVMSRQRRSFTANFLLEAGETLDEEARQKFLAQHWIFEANAQGLGVVALASAPEGVVPVLMEVGRSSFAKVPVFGGDTLISRFTNISVNREQIFGNATTYLGDTVVASQQELLLGLYPVSTIRERIEQARQKGPN